MRKHAGKLRGRDCHNDNFFGFLSSNIYSEAGFSDPNVETYLLNIGFFRIDGRRRKIHPSVADF